MSSANTSELGPSSVWPRLPLALGSIPTQRGRGPIELYLKTHSVYISVAWRQCAPPEARKVVACWRVDPLFRTRRPRAQSSYEYVTNCELISNLWLRPPCVDRTCHHAPHSGTSPGPLALFADAQGVPHRVQHRSCHHVAHKLSWGHNDKRGPCDLSIGHRRSTLTPHPRRRSSPLHARPCANTHTHRGQMRAIRPDGPLPQRPTRRTGHARHGAPL